eukprot:m.14083 g.14083  ORF g.14083 m.14083 type:complete len:96 (-) comp4981_c0_seq1:4-291(-)
MFFNCCDCSFLSINCHFLSHIRFHSNRIIKILSNVFVRHDINCKQVQQIYRQTITKTQLTKTIQLKTITTKNDNTTSKTKQQATTHHYQHNSQQQ